MTEPMTKEQLNALVDKFDDDEAAFLAELRRLGFRDGDVVADLGNGEGVVL